MTIDPIIARLVLCMALRNHEGNEAQVCFFIIQLLLLKPNEFRNRVNEFCRTMSPEHHLLQVRGHSLIQNPEWVVFH